MTEFQDRQWSQIAWLSQASYPRSPDSANTSQVSSEIHDGPRKELGLGLRCAALDFGDWGWGHSLALGGFGMLWESQLSPRSENPYEASLTCDF